MTSLPLQGNSPTLRVHIAVIGSCFCNPKVFFSKEAQQEMGQCSPCDVLYIYIYIYRVLLLLSVNVLLSVPKRTTIKWDHVFFYSSMDRTQAPGQVGLEAYERTGFRLVSNWQMVWDEHGFVSVCSSEPRLVVSSPRRRFRRGRWCSCMAGSARRQGLGVMVLFEASFLGWFRETTRTPRIFFCRSLMRNP